MKKSLSVKVILQQMRIKSWLKNVFVFFALFFSQELFEWDKFLQTVLLAFSFCLVSSAVYVMNDICDVEKDRKHAVKKNRPIASGLISIRGAWTLWVCLIIAGFGLALSVKLSSFLLVLIYFFINMLYSKFLKTKAVFDCFCIAAGFMLRVLVGGTIIESGVSEWMFLTVISLSLFMAFGKRRGELCSYGVRGTRDVLENYEMDFLNGIIFMCAGLTMAFYSLWSIAQKSNLIYTVPIALFIVIRYLLLVFLGHSEADPTTLILSDKTLLVSCGFYAVVMLFFLYGPQLF